LNSVADIRFLGNLPSHWKTVSIKWILDTPVTDGPHETPEFIDSGIPFLSVDGIQNGKLVFEGSRFISTNDHARYSRKCLPAYGDVLLGKAASVGKVALVDTKNEFNIWSPLALLRIRADKGIGEFLYYALTSPPLQAQCAVFSNSNTQNNLGMGDIASLRIPLPPVSEQRTIAAFLDHETARIDRLIEKQERLIELLKEKRQAVISHAVTKGLNPDAPMKDSGVEWLGEVPAHWAVASLKHSLEAVADVDHMMPASVDSGVPYLMTGDLRSFASLIDFESCKQVSREGFLKLSRKVNTSKGDVIMARYATIGTVCYVDIDEDFVVSYSCVTIRPRQNYTTGLFLFYYFQSDAFVQGILNKVNANTQSNVGISDLREVQIALPDLTEQKETVDHIEENLRKLDRIIEKSSYAVELLTERRSALISAAVTGKIDVRDWKPADPTTEGAATA